MQFARVTLSQSSATDVSLLVQLAWEIGGAVAFGALAGALFALYLRFVAREVTLALLGFCIIISRVGALGGAEPLLAAMTAGMVIQNVAVPQGDALKTAIQRGALPVLVVFFVSVGASLQLDALGRSEAWRWHWSRSARHSLGVTTDSAANLEPVSELPVERLISQAGITSASAIIAAEFQGAVVCSSIRRRLKSGACTRDSGRSPLVWSESDRGLAGGSRRNGSSRRPSPEVRSDDTPVFIRTNDRVAERTAAAAGRPLYGGFRSDRSRISDRPAIVRKCIQLAAACSERLLAFQVERDRRNLPAGDALDAQIAYRERIAMIM
jgi:hypothetical protein